MKRGANARVSFMVVAGLVVWAILRLRHQVFASSSHPSLRSQHSFAASQWRKPVVARTGIEPVVGSYLWKHCRVRLVSAAEHQGAEAKRAEGDQARLRNLRELKAADVARY